MSLNIQKIKDNRDEILKAEIVSLFMLIEKTSLGWWHEKEYLQNVENDEASDTIPLLLKQITENLSLRSPFIEELDINAYDDFVNSNWRGWRNIESTSEDYKRKILQVIYGSCEGLNSGIEKGSPKEDEKIPGSTPFLVNSYGCVPKNVEPQYLDKTRNILFSNIQEIDSVIDFNEKEKLETECDNLFDKDIQTLIKELSDSQVNFSSIKGVRKKIYKLLQLLYSRIPSDTRFPANDTSLFAQAFMSTSLFKSSLSSLCLEADNIEIKEFDAKKLKWRILGIQYDKLKLTEKALKVSNITWYRNKINEVDDEIKSLLEENIPIGNEIYRDETGSYFLVGENIGINIENNDFDKLNDEIKIKEEIDSVFIEKFKNEVLPCISLTKASRGIMGIGYFVEKSKENFLKYNCPEKFELEGSCFNSGGKCEICKIRLADRDNDDKLICPICSSRTGDRLLDWVCKLDEDPETIWLDDLHGKNGRIALISLKFELQDWLNGNSINGMLMRDDDYSAYRRLCIHVFGLIKKNILKEDVKSLEFNNQDKEKIKSFLSLFDENAILKPYDEISLKLENGKNIESVPSDNGYRNTANTFLRERNWLESFAFFDEQNSTLLSNKKKRKEQAFDGYDENVGIKGHLHEIFRINYLRNLINNILMERSVGLIWENFISCKLSSSHLVNFDDRYINWKGLTDEDINLLSEILLQFSLRKNPSPARLKRVWETTEDFFKEIKSFLSTDEFLGLSKRYIWNNIDIAEGEYADGDILFWASGSTVYLITSTESFKDKDTFYLKSVNGQNHQNVIPLKKEDRSEKEFKPFFSILDPTPVSWQFAVSAEKVPKLIKAIEKRYYENFKWVYGKLPLHIGVVFQDHKKPLYLGIKALRKIRRDGMSRLDLRKEISAKELKAEQKDAFNYQIPPEETALCEKYYSLFEKKEGQGKYEFYLFPEENRKTKLGTTAGVDDNDKFFYYPNTFDFEFLDTNARRNEIFYDKGKRYLKLKRNRPYRLRDFKKFEKFRSYFSDKKQSIKLQKMAGLIYSKLEDWQGENSSLNKFLKSAFINILELKTDEQKKEIAYFLGSSSWETLFDSEDKNIDENLYMFLDMFEFWHTALKEI